MFKGDWQSARDAATASKKWLLVNIQDAGEFQCQTLNRDVWSNDAVKTIVREHFLFWQVRLVYQLYIKTSCYTILKSITYEYMYQIKTYQNNFSNTKKVTKHKDTSHFIRLLNGLMLP